MQKRYKGCHFAQTTERHRAQTTQSRQKPHPPTPSPPGPGPPISLERYRKSGPGGPGLGTWARPSPCPLCLVYDVLTEPEPLAPYQTNKLTTPRLRGRRTSPACGSCRRPLKKALTNMRCKKTCSGAGESMIFEKMRPRLHQSTISHVRPPAPGPPISLERYRKSGPGGGGGW